MAPKLYRVREITQTTWQLRRSRSIKVTDSGTNRKLLCDFLLVINSNLPPMLRRFQLSYGRLLVKLSLSIERCLTLTPRWINFTSSETRGIILPDAENRTIDRIFIRLDTIPECDGRTDKHTESLWLLQRSALRAMPTRCKNCAVNRLSHENLLFLQISGQSWQLSVPK